MALLAELLHTCGATRRALCKDIKIACQHLNIKESGDMIKGKEHKEN